MRRNLARLIPFPSPLCPDAARKEVLVLTTIVLPLTVSGMARNQRMEDPGRIAPVRSPGTQCEAFFNTNPTPRIARRPGQRWEAVSRMANGLRLGPAGRWNNRRHDFLPHGSQRTAPKTAFFQLVPYKHENIEAQIHAGTLATTVHRHGGAGFLGLHGVAEPGAGPRRVQVAQ